MPLHERLGEGLAALQTGGGGVMAEDRDAQGPHGITHPRHKRNLGSRHDQVRVVRGAPGRHRRRVLQIQGGSAA